MKSRVTTVWFDSSSGPPGSKGVPEHRMDVGYPHTLRFALVNRSRCYDYESVPWTRCKVKGPNDHHEGINYCSLDAPLLTG